MNLDPTQSSDGKTTLSWSLQEGTQIEIQQSVDVGFHHPKILYQGSDSATVITGLTDGEYHYRGRQVYPNGDYSPWSPPVSLQVTHHSLVRAALFFFAGGVVFLATLLLIVLGARSQGAEH